MTAKSVVLRTGEDLRAGSCQGDVRRIQPSDAIRRGLVSESSLDTQHVDPTELMENWKQCCYQVLCDVADLDEEVRQALEDAINGEGISSHATAAVFLHGCARCRETALTEMLSETSTDRMIDPQHSSLPKSWCCTHPQTFTSTAPLLAIMLFADGDHDFLACVTYGAPYTMCGGVCYALLQFGDFMALDAFVGEKPADAVVAVFTLVERVNRQLPPSHPGGTSVELLKDHSPSGTLEQKIADGTIVRLYWDVHFIATAIRDDNQIRSASGVLRFSVRSVWSQKKYSKGLFFALLNPQGHVLYDVPEDQMGFNQGYANYGTAGESYHDFHVNMPIANEVYSAATHARFIARADNFWQY